VYVCGVYVFVCVCGVYVFVCVCVTLRRVLATIVAVEKRKVLYIMSECVSE